MNGVTFSMNSGIAKMLIVLLYGSAVRTRGTPCPPCTGKSWLSMFTTSAALATSSVKVLYTGTSGFACASSFLMSASIRSQSLSLQ